MDEKLAEAMITINSINANVSDLKGFLSFPHIPYQTARFKNLAAVMGIELVMEIKWSKNELSVHCTSQ